MSSRVVSARHEANYQSENCARFSARSADRSVDCRSAAFYEQHCSRLGERNCSRPTVGKRRLADSQFAMKHRIERVCEVLKRELGQIILRELTFPTPLVTISGVDITPDLKQAHVYVSALGTDVQRRSHACRP